MLHPSLTTPSGARRRRTALRPLRRIVGLAALTLALVMLAGCGGLTPPPPPATTLPLESGQTLGQSFVAYDAGLVALEVLLAPDLPGPGVIELQLRQEPGSPLLATASLPIAAVTRPGPYRFDLSQPITPARASLLAELSVRDGGRVLAQVWEGETNPDGTLFRQSEPQQGDLMLRPRYGGVPFVTDWVGRLGWWALLTLAAGALFVLPGWALLSGLWPGFAAQPLATRATLALGLGVAVAPLYLLWTDALGLHPGAWHAWATIGLAAAWLGFTAWLRRRRPAGPAPGDPDEGWAMAALLAVTGLLVATRFFLLHRVEVPLWGDSYHHTMLVQLLLDHGGLFDSWRPYVPYESLTVQFGFPAHGALLAWVLGGDSAGATLAAGQLLNIAAALSLYPLACKLGRSPLGGVAAVVVAGMLSPLPGFYVNWGRYAQLAGQVALPTALWLTWTLVEGEGPSQLWGLALVVGAAVSGMLLSYYRMAFFYVPFVLLLVLVVALPPWLRAPRQALGGLLALTVSGAACVALFLPWAGNLMGSSLAGRATDASVTSMGLADVVRADYEVWRSVTTFVPLGLLVLAGAAVVAGLAARRWMVAALAPWTLLVASVVAGRLINLPGSGLMQSFAVVIALYIPVSLACGALAGMALGWLGPRAVEVGRPLAAAALLGAALLAAPQQAQVLGPSFVIVTRPDQQAMAWIAANSPPEARFLVNGFRIYGGTSAVGADGGWWIPLLAGRANTMPPQYALLNEVPAPPDYSERVVDLVATLEESSPASPAGEAALCAEGVTHVYLGQGQGQVGAGADSLLSAESLLASPEFELVYQRDLVYIFAFTRDRCGPEA